MIQDGSGGSVIVTGGSRGIGRATVVALARAGYEVCINYEQSKEAAQRLAARIVAMGGRAIPVRADVSDEREVQAMFDACAANLAPLRGLVNSAGVLPPLSSFVDVPARRMRRVVEVNVIGSMLCAREAIRRMSMASGGAGGAITNLSSAASRLGAPGEYVDYAASKGAVEALTIGLAREVATQGIRVNAVRPGFITTRLHAAAGGASRLAAVASGIPMQRTGAAREVAAAIAWLMSPGASYTTGAILDVTGGR